MTNITNEATSHKKPNKTQTTNITKDKYYNYKRNKVKRFMVHDATR